MTQETTLDTILVLICLILSCFMLGKYWEETRSISSLSNEPALEASPASNPDVLTLVSDHLSKYPIEHIEGLGQEIERLQLTFGDRLNSSANLYARAPINYWYASRADRLGNELLKLNRLIESLAKKTGKQAYLKHKANQLYIDIILELSKLKSKQLSQTSLDMDYHQLTYTTYFYCVKNGLFT